MSITTETGRTLQEGNAEFFDHEVRRTTRAALLRGSIPPHLVDEITDMAVHAAQQSVDTLVRHAFTHPELNVAVAVWGVAASLALHRIGELREIVGNAAAECGGQRQQIVAQVRR